MAQNRSKVLLLSQENLRFSPIGPTLWDEFSILPKLSTYENKIQPFSIKNKHILIDPPLQALTSSQLSS